MDQAKKGARVGRVRLSFPDDVANIATHTHCVC